ncbi:MAG: glycosyltransferase family 2 protein [Micrococcales bacterium]
MSANVTALLVVHNEFAGATRALSAIQNQTRKPDRIVLLDSSTKSTELALSAIKVEESARLGSIIRTGLAETTSSAEHWFWLVHDDSEPANDALEQLLIATENSESVVQVGPMQRSASRVRQISQLGITLSRFGEIINSVKGQLDQSQHDQVSDVLAVGTSGMLVRTDAYALVGGLDDRAPALAADVDLSMRFRRHGFRVVTQPRAKVQHSSLTLNGQRGRRWLGGSTKTALRKATIHLRLVHDPILLALLYWLALPITTVYRMFWRLAKKQPSFMWPELRAGIWGFLTVFSRLAARSKAGKLPTKTLKPLRATWQDVSKHKRQALEAEESAQSLASFERGEHEIETAEQVKNFTRSGGWLFSLILLALSWQQLPVSEAVTGGSAIPLSNDWFTLFARAGASWQPIGQGFVAPSDPFNWVLLALGSLTFWSPNLSLVLLLWLARALAFASAWRAFSLLTAKAWQRNLGALAYALLPAFTAAISHGEFAAIVATILTPWLVFAVARAAGLGRSGSARSDTRTWSWVGLAGILLAAVGAASPTLIVLSLIGLGLVAFTKIRRLGYLFWIPLPLAAIYLPLAFHDIVGLAHPLALLADPTVGVANHATMAGALLANVWWVNIGLAVFAVMAILSLLTKRWVVATAIFTFGLVAYTFGAFVQSLRFPENISNSGNSIAAVVGLTLVGLVVHFAAALKSKPALGVVAVLMLLASAPLGYIGLTQPTSATGSEAAVVPLLLQKQAEQGTDLQLLVVNQDDNSYRVQWIPIAGVHLEDSNIAYRFAGRSTGKDKTYQSLAQVVGDLISANGAAEASVLKDNLVGYVLVPSTSANASVIAAFESSELLEGAGLTPFGELWRVVGTSAADAPQTWHNPWSITKLVQLATLLGFMLLAIPSRGRTKREGDSEIFIDQSESELDV